MAADYFFAVKSIGQSTCNGRKASTLLGAARHNKRQIQAEQGARGNIDPARTAKNESIAGPATPEEIDALARALMAGAGIAKLRKNCAQAIELVFSLPPGADIDVREYFQRCTAWAGEQFGAANILSADIHHDEPASIHCHVLALPLADGKMQGSALISKPATRVLTKSFFEAVAARFGLRRPSPALAGEKRAMAVRDVLARLETMGDPVTRSAIWPTVRRDIEHDPAPYLQNLGLVAREPAGKPGRTMAQIFTSTGKGQRRESDQTGNPIGFGGDARNPIGISKRAPKTQTLSCVGFREKALSESTAQVRARVPCQHVEPDHLAADVERREVAMAAQAALGKHRGTAPAPQAMADAALHVMAAIANPGQAGTLSLNELSALGIAGVDAGSLASVQSAIAAAQGSAVDTQTKLQAMADGLTPRADAVTHLHVARTAAADATRRHANRAPPPADRGDGTTREHDADFDVAAWRGESGAGCDGEDRSAAPHQPAPAARDTQTTKGNPWPT